MADTPQPATDGAGGRAGAWLWAIAVFAVALALRAEYLRELWQTPFADELTLLGDSRYYHTRGREIAAGKISRQPGSRSGSSPAGTVCGVSGQSFMS